MISGVVIRRTEDLELIQELDRLVFPLDNVIDGEDLYDSLWWVSYLGKEPIGYCGMRPEFESPPALGFIKPKAFLSRVGVLPDFRGGGLQTRMIRTRVAEAKRLEIPRVYTYTWVGSIASQRSLLKCGFKPYRFQWEEAQRQSFLYFEKLI